MVGSVVAPVWPPTGGGSAMGRRAGSATGSSPRCARPAASARRLRELGVRQYGVVRIDSAVRRGGMGARTRRRTRKIAATFSEACDVAEDFGERLAAEGEICWGGMHSWAKMVELLERVGRPQTLGFPGGHGAHAAFHHGLQRAGGPAAAGKFGLEPDGRTGEAYAKARRARCAPGPSTSTSPRTTRRCMARARTTRPANTACRTIPTANSTLPIKPAYWLRGEDGRPTRALATSVGTAACSPTR